MSKHYLFLKYMLKLNDKKLEEKKISFEEHRVKECRILSICY